ncbi:MAG: flagellar brake protein [Lachnospiraceae bacterium]|nr:flagellar brake protein [Lachnospiraceae bacterium]
MIQKILKVGDRIEMKRLAAAGKAEGQEAKLYNSQLLDFVDDRNINVSVPIESGHLVPLEIGGRFEMRFITVNGIYVCKGEVTNRFKQNNMYFLAVKLISELVKDQRRQYFRLAKIRPLSYHKLIEEEKKIIVALATNQLDSDIERRNMMVRLKTIEPEQKEGSMANISGGGLKFYSDEELAKGDFIRISLLLDEADAAPYDLFGKVIASESLPDRTLKNSHRVEFINMPKEVREKIVRYIFNEERRQRQKDTGM